MNKKIIMFIMAITLIFMPINLEANALSLTEFQFNPPLYEMDVPDYELIIPIDPILLTPSMGLDFTMVPINPAVIDGLYTNDLFYVNSSMASAPEDLANPYVGIESDGTIKFTYRYNKHIVKIDHVAVNAAFSMVGDVIYETIDSDEDIMEASFEVRMDQAHLSDDIVGKIITQVKFKVLENGYGDSTVIASAWTEDAYQIEQVGSKNIGSGIIIPIFGNVYEDRANYETLPFSVESLTIHIMDEENNFLTPAYQAPYPADNKVDAPEITGYDLQSASPLDVFSSLGQRRLLAVFKYAEEPEEAEEPESNDVTINCYFDLEPPIIYTSTIEYPISGYVFAPNLEIEGFKLLDDIVYKAVDPGDTVTFRYLSNATGTHTAYIGGYPDSTVKPEKGITREEMASILFRLIKDPTKASFVRTGNKFSDVALDSPVWGGKEIEYVASLRLFEGYPSGKFLAKNNITREEFVTVLTRFANYTPPTLTVINTGSWSQQYVSLAVSSGYTEGLENSPAGEDWLNPMWRQAPVTRAEVIVMLNNLFNRKLSTESVGIPASPFTDLPSDYWALYDILEATTTHNYDRNSDGSENYLE